MVCGDDVASVNPEGGVTVEVASAQNMWTMTRLPDTTPDGTGTLRVVAGSAQTAEPADSQTGAATLAS